MYTPFPPKEARKEIQRTILPLAGAVHDVKTGSILIFVFMCEDIAVLQPGCMRLICRSGDKGGRGGQLVAEWAGVWGHSWWPSAGPHAGHL